MKKTSKGRTRTTRTPLPPGLLAIAALINEANYLDDLRQALDAARKAIQQRPGEYPDDIHAFIEHSAKTGHFKEDFAKVQQVADELKIDVGGVHNAFVTPALLAGMAVAYCVLKDGAQ
jgi:hypothetical protein